MAIVADYTDGRLVPHKGKKSVPPHLRPDYWPTQKQQRVVPVVKIRRGGKVIAAIELDDELLSLVQNI